MKTNKFFIATLLTLFLLLSNNSFANQEEEDLEDFFGDSQSQEIHDPFEKANRKVYAFNESFDQYFLEPIALTYRDFVPAIPRKMIRNFLTNLSLPVSIMNSIFQGNVDNSLATTSTFLINSTIGIGGLFDVAGNKNIRYNEEGFGQTLGYYKVSEGPYLVIPFLGPSTVRNITGFGIDKAINPVDFNVLKIGDTSKFLSDEARLSFNIAEAIDTREELQNTLSDIRQDSFDPYATMRSFYLQNYRAKVNNN